MSHVTFVSVFSPVPVLPKTSLPWQLVMLRTEEKITMSSGPLDSRVSLARQPQSLLVQESCGWRDKKACGLRGEPSWEAGASMKVKL